MSQKIFVGLDKNQRENTFNLKSLGRLRHSCSSNLVPFTGPEMGSDTLFIYIWFYSYHGNILHEMLTTVTAIFHDRKRNTNGVVKVLKVLFIPEVTSKICSQILVHLLTQLYKLPLENGFIQFARKWKNNIFYYTLRAGK